MHIEWSVVTVRYSGLVLEGNRQTAAHNDCPLL